MCVFSLCVCLCSVCMQYVQRPEEGITFPRTGVTGDCELPCERGGGLDLGPLTVQLVPLTAELSL